MAIMVHSSLTLPCSLSPNWVSEFCYVSQDGGPVGAMGTQSIYPLSYSLFITFLYEGFSIVFL